MQKVKIIITGEEVHGVGYRSVLISKALELGIDHFNTFNTFRDDLQAVIVLIEGDEEQLDEFMNLVQTKRPERAKVSSIIDEEYDRTVPPIERCIQSFQMGQWAKGIPILLDIRDILQSVKEDTGKMLEKQDRMLEKQDSMLEKQDRMLEKQDSMLEKQDTLKSVVERGFRELKEEHIKTREMSVEIFHSEVQELRQEINFLRSSVEEIRKKIGIA